MYKLPPRPWLGPRTEKRDTLPACWGALIQGRITGMQ